MLATILECPSLRALEESALGIASVTAWDAKRYCLDGRALIADHLDAGILALSARFAPDDSPSLKFPGRFVVSACRAGGWLLRNENSQGPHYWIPTNPCWRGFDADGHILAEQEATLDELDVAPDHLHLRFQAARHDSWLHIQLWRFEAEGAALIEDLTALTTIETAGYFTLGSHTCIRQPSDFFRHIVQGFVYEDRFSWPHRRRICSENDAHALFLIASGLQRATDKRIYELIRKQLLLAVLERQSPDGGFRHGEWTERMESHFRLHCSGMHLLMDALDERSDAAITAALKRAARFLSDKRDQTAAGTWFLHDELELSVESMRKAPFKWLPGRVLGKAPQNMLVLNTHLDALIALDRYHQLTQDEQYTSFVRSGLEAAHAVINLRHGEFWYRLVFRAINLTLLPTARAVDLPLWQRALKRIGWKYLIPRLYRMKNRWPRLVMPGGYIDRHLALAPWAFDYHTVNLMDLLRAARRFDDGRFEDVLQAALRFTQESGVLARWAELDYERYALGFLGEALWHACTRYSDLKYRAWLAASLVTLARLNMGSPPSVLGVNAEAGNACRALQPLHPAIRTAAWQSARGTEMLLVNADAAVSFPLSSSIREVDLPWRDPANKRVAPSQVLAPGDWVIAQV